MVKKSKGLNSKYLKQCFEINEETWRLVRLYRPLSHFKSRIAWNGWNQHQGTVVTGQSNGQPRVTLDGISYYQKHVIYCMVFKRWPDTIKLIDGDCSNLDPNNMEEFNKKGEFVGRCGRVGCRCNLIYGAAHE